MSRSWVLTLVVCALVSLIGAGCDIEQISPALYRGPDPTEHTLHKLKQMGIKTIVSVRLTPHKRRMAKAKEMGFDWIHIPTGIFITPRKPEVDQFMALVNDKKRHPIYLACTLGADRTGYYIAHYRMQVLGWPNDKAETEMKNQFSVWWPAWYVFHDYKHKVRKYQVVPQEDNELVSY